MGKFDKILICTDLDGTLLKKDKSISEENKKAIEYFKSEGGYFTFVTGRSASTVGEMYEKVRPNVPIGCFNGGGIYDKENEVYLFKMPTHRDILKLVECVDENVEEAGILMHTFEKIYFSKENEITDWFMKITGAEHIVKHYNDIEEDFSKVVFCFEVEETFVKIKALLDKHPLKDKFDFVRSEKHLYEILPRDSGKGLAIKKLAELLETDKTVAIGDFYNDISMFEEAKVGIAVSNACKEAIESADYVTVSNEESAIAKVIFDIEKGNIEV